MKYFLLTLAVVLSLGTKAQSLQFKTGDKAPAFTAVSHTGSNITVPQKGITILFFYRGYWCPFCNKQLSALNDSLALLQEKGASVIAVTPEKYESVNITIEKTKAGFTIISDTSNSILKSYGVDFKVDDNTVLRYKKFGIDFTEVNGNTDNTLPVPAVFIIDADGKFKYIWFDKDYRKRPSVKELLEQL